MIFWSQRVITILLAAGVSLALLGAALYGSYSYLDGAAGAAKGAVIEISTGMNSAEIALVLKKKGLIRSALFFRAIAHRRGYEPKFRAGKFILPRKMKTSELALYLVSATPIPPDIKVTVIEGLTVRETASILFRKAKVDSVLFVKTVLNKTTADSLGIDNATLEGYLYPDTYYIREGAKPIEVIRKMVSRFRIAFTDSLKARAAWFEFSVNQTVALASIIEGEAASDEERAVISSVFHRRLNMGLPLQANPTVQYALGVKRRVFNGDLEVESPYNTYLHKGLPPGPVASPGMKSILAALYPADTKYLYFVSDNQGGHVFSKTLKEHQAAVSRYKVQRLKSDTQNESRRKVP
ncbi:MAG: endolytic transglycosylase MltG [Candidatus Latescibacter sp.]|nr:endolytic transglycosylase MltG [Candidatus Latescibacter sp.]